MRAEDVLRMQSDLKTQLLSVHTHQYTGIVLDEDHGWNIDERMRDRIGQMWCEVERQVLAQADAYLVTKDMYPLIALNAATVPLNQVKVTDTTAPSREGFMVFEDGLRIFNGEGQMSVYRAASWHVLDQNEISNKMSGAFADAVDLSTDPRVNSGVLIQFYRSFRDIDRDWFLMSLQDQISEEERGSLRLIGDPHLAKTLAMPHGIDLDTFLRGAGKGWEEADDDELREYYGRQLMVWSIWDLMSQSVMVDRQPQHMTVNRREAWRRKKIPARVSVILLRRQYANWHQTQPGTGRQLDHRVKVRAHPHKYRVGPGRSQVVTKWIEAYERGPEGTPLVDRPKVTKLCR